MNKLEPRKLLPKRKRKEHPVKKRSFFTRTVSFAVMLVIVLGAVALVVYRDNLNFDALRRAIAYRQIEKDASQSSKFSYEEDSSNRFASYRNGLIRASSTGIDIYSQNGQKVMSETVPINTPAILISGSAAAVYDIGGQNLYTFSNSREAMHLKLSDDFSFFSAGLNNSGWLAATSQTKGYKATVSVYNDRQALKFQWNSSSRFVSDAAVFNDCETMGAVTIGQSGTEFQSKLVIYKLDSDKQYAETDLGNRTVLSIRPIKDHLAVLAENDFLTMDSRGRILNTYSYENRHLRSFSMDGDGFSVLHLGKYIAGSLGDLVTLDASGRQIAALGINEDVLNVSAAGRYIAVLYATHLDIYSKDLKLYARLSDTGNAQNALMRADGSVMLVGIGSAWLYLPK